jgi:hypothetical protein
LWKEIDSQEAIRRIEHSIQADTFQDAEGRLGIRAQLTSAQSGIKYVGNHEVFEYEANLSKDDIYSQVEIYYLDDPSTDKFSMVTRTNLLAIYKYHVNRTLPIYTSLTTTAQANTLASAFINAMMKPIHSFTVPRVLFTCLPGDLIYFSRSRFFNSTGSTNNKLLRILSIGKAQSAGRTTIKSEEV